MLLKINGVWSDVPIEHHSDPADILEALEEHDTASADAHYSLFC